MIFGIGTDIVQVSRMNKWVENPEIIKRFFNPVEIMEKGSDSTKNQHYAARFAAKEAFSKALGTGITGFSLRDVYITNDKSGKPILNVKNSAADVLREKCGKCKIHISLSHEKEYATAFVVIET
jgi:holo-[acyl-carrier protein] synthase